MTTTILKIAANNGFKAEANADGSVAIFIPTTRNGADAGDIVETVRTIDQAYAALGY